MNWTCAVVIIKFPAHYFRPDSNMKQLLMPLDFQLEIFMAQCDNCNSKYMEVDTFFSKSLLYKRITEFPCKENIEYLIPFMVKIMVV